jgi:hypothetical protein
MFGAHQRVTLLCDCCRFSEHLFVREYLFLRTDRLHSRSFHEASCPNVDTNNVSSRQVLVKHRHALSQPA